MVHKKKAKKKTMSSPGSSKGKEIEFLGILSEESQYGTIWNGFNRDDKVPCVVKMVTLRTGVHYNQDKGAFCDEKGNKNKKVTSYFSKDGTIPFLHTKFNKSKSM